MRERGADDPARRRRALVPVPLHPSRRRERGFNQAADLARHLGLPVVRRASPHAPTADQTELPAAQRHGNVRGAFALRAACASRWLARIVVAGRRCEHDRRDAGRVRAGAEGGGERRGARAYRSASRAATALNTSAATASFARSPSSTTQPLAAAWRGSSRGRGPAGRDRARSGRDRRPCAVTAVSGAMSSRIVSAGGGRNLCMLGQPRRHRGRRPRRRRRSTPCSDRRPESGHRPSHRCRSGFRS